MNSSARSQICSIRTCRPPFLQQQFGLNFGSLIDEGVAPRWLVALPQSRSSMLLGPQRHDDRTRAVQKGSLHNEDAIFFDCRARGNSMRYIGHCWCRSIGGPTSHAFLGETVKEAPDTYRRDGAGSVPRAARQYFHYVYMT